MEFHLLRMEVNQKQYQQAQPSNQRLSFRNDQPQQLDPKQLQK